MRIWWSQTRTELALNMRQGEQLLVSLGIPLAVLVFFSLVDVLPLPPGTEEPVDFLAPGVLALAVMSSAMVSLAIATGFERHYHVLKRLGSTPLGRGRLVAAKVGLVVVIQAVQAVVLVGAALALGWEPSGRFALAIPAVVAGTAAFAGIGLLMAGTLRATLTLGLANSLYLVLLLLGGMVVPLEELPSAMRWVAEALPAAALSEVMRSALGDSEAGAAPWLVLGTWAVLAPAAAIRLFRWD